MTWTTNIQYKGTDLCMDFICPGCGTNSHYDGYFHQVIKCPECGDAYELARDIPAVKLAEDDGAIEYAKLPIETDAS